MHDLLSEPTRSWFAVKAAIALSPIFTFLIADVMGWLLRRTLWRRLEVALQVEGEPERHEPSGVAAPPG